MTTKLPFKAAVLHINSAAAEATSPTMRIARYTATRLGIPLIHSLETAAQHANTKFDVLFVKLGVLKFSNHRDDALKIYGNAKRVINLENDYSFKPDPRLRKLQPEWQVWGTVPDNVKVHGGSYVNWNVLTWLYPRPWADRLKGYKAEPNRLLYYGAYRPDRVESFKRWFVDTPCEVVIGARSTHIKKFQALSPTLKLVNFRTPNELAKLRATALYLEDDTSHDLYCSLANRFFECLQLGIPMVLDAAGHKTYEAAKLPNWQKFSVPDKLYAHYSPMLKNPVATAIEQRELWYRDFDLILAKQFDKAVDKLLAR